MLKSKMGYNFEKTMVQKQANRLWILTERPLSKLSENHKLTLIDGTKVMTEAFVQIL